MSSISINNCVFMGRLTGEPEMRYTRSNKPVTTFRIAVSRRSSADAGPAAGRRSDQGCTASQGANPAENRAGRGTGGNG